MGVFSKAYEEGLDTGVYKCDKCGHPGMYFEDEEERVLICPYCGRDVDVFHYGWTDEEYEALFPTEAEFFERYKGMEEGE